VWTQLCLRHIHASSTAASEKGALIEDILHTADWSTDSIFRQFYYRPTIHKQFSGQGQMRVSSARINYPHLYGVELLVVFVP